MLLMISLGYLAFGLFALAMFSHFKDSFSRAPTKWQRYSLYICAWLVLGGSFAGCITQLGIAYGLIFFTGMMSVAALLVIFTLSYRAKALAPLMLSSNLVIGLFSIAN